MKLVHQLKTFENIVANYDGKLPLHRFLALFFKQNKQMGSSDRRWANRYLFSFFRLGNILIDLDNISRLAIADFLCNQTSSLVVEHYLPNLVDKIQLSVPEKVKCVQKIYPNFDLSAVFQFKDNLTAALQDEVFYLSFFTQPNLFIRVPSKQIENLIRHLKKQDIAVEQLSETSLALPNATKLEQVIGDKFLYEVQDLSSQQTGMYFEPKANDFWWDCCTASGGKSLLLHQFEPSVSLLVSDVRESILFNLDERFKLAGIKKYQKKVIDLTKPTDEKRFDSQFDGIILDAPCSGSGTWGRSPENLRYFDASKIEYFTQLQKTIATNVIKHLKIGQPLIYITCSVFKQENEQIVDYLIQNTPLELQKMEIVKGYQHKADTMFVARFIKK
ncbi:MAG: RsmB/NOP family class I SAM-dependent RNA methyltransferase [Sphingobacteriaceae bacterium]|nr:RsmB/NOP family class I SAM-dependent RNA methyltransferase [Sphingobacteriaceae bacterium]